MRTVALLRMAHVAATCALLASPARAATFTVDAERDQMDASPGDGICSTNARMCTLRAAIQESNALAGADVILVPPGMYPLEHVGSDEDLCASGDLDILDSVTIHGAGARVSIIHGLGFDRCLDVHAGACDITGLGLRGGWRPDCDFGGGMAVRSAASVVVRECHVAENSSHLGAGIWVGAGGSLLIDSTTISGNWAWGCGDDSPGVGGGVCADYDAVLVLSNTTVSGNRAGCGGGIAAQGPSATLRNCTVTGNRADADCEGSGLWGWEFELANTIMAGNADAGVTNCWGTIVSLGYNVLDPLPWYGCALTGDLTGNVVGLPALLGPLADNGGPVPTRALLAGSPAIDAGNPLAPGSGGVACEPGDQRGLARPQDGDLDSVPTCDIGAFELAFETGRCADASDNDADTLADCSDPDCCTDATCAGAPETACCDGIDNDCDGRTDRDDSSCAAVPECIEDDCSNGGDDDGDSLVDCADDECCADPACAGEPEARCCDAVDNDCDGLTDGADPDCAPLSPCYEASCTNGIDDDGDGASDCADPDCRGRPSCVERDCANGRDDDGDALVDCADLDCAGAPPCVESDCIDGGDDDGDALIDCADPDCRGTPLCDDDGDGVPNALDCAPDDPGVHSPPTEVPRLDVTRRVDLGADVVALAWSDLSPMTGPELVGDVVTGVITRMWADRGLIGASCLAGDVPMAQAIDVRALPGPSDGFWYLVRAENVCLAGTLGNDSAGIPRDVGGMSCP